MATHSSVLAWRIPGMGEPGGLPSMGSHRVGHDWSDLAAAAASSLTQKRQGEAVKHSNLVNRFCRKASAPSNLCMYLYCPVESYKN